MSPIGHKAAAAAMAALLCLGGCDLLPKPGPGEGKTVTDAIVPPTKPSAEQLGAAAGADIKVFYDGEFEGFGAEPDWRLDLLGNWASFTRPGLEEIGGVPTPPDVRVSGALVEAGSLSIVLKAGACTHPTGGQLPYVMRVFYDGVTYDGCARRVAAGAAAPTPSWAASLPELIPAIDACLAKAPGEQRRVSIAYVADGTQINVRLLEDDGGRYECSVGGESPAIEPLSDSDILQGERDPIFTRAPAKPPEGKCFKTEEAKGPDGAVLGALTKRVC